MTISRWIRQLSTLSLALAVAGSAVAAPEGSWSALGPEGGRAGWLAVDPTDAMHVYTTMSGPRPLYVSEDGGVTWRSTGFGLPSFGLSRLAVAPASPARVYAAFDSNEPGALAVVYRSDDGAETFAPVGTANEPLDPYAMVADPVAADTVYMIGQPDDFAAGEHGLLRSTDGGASWSGFAFAGQSVIDLTFAPNGVYAVGGRELFRSTDGGASWSDLTGSELPASQMPVSFAYADGDSPTLLVGTYPFGEPAGKIYRSSDAGATWSPADLSGTDDLGHGVPYIIFLRPVPGEPSVVFGLSPFGDQLIRSTDHGASWSHVPWTYPAERHVWDLVATADRLLAATSNHGVVHTDHGETWQSGTGFRSARIHALAALAPGDGQNLLAGLGSVLHGSTDAGSSWQATGHTENGRWISALSPDPAAATTLVAVDSSIRRSTDGGASWDEVLAAAADGTTWYQSLARDPHDSGHLVAVEGHSSGDDTLLASTDGGLTWAPTAAPADTNLRIVFDPVVAGRQYLLAGDVLYRRDGAASSWESTVLEVAGTPFSLWQMVIDPRDGAFYGSNYDAAGTVYRSTDAGETWAPTTPVGDNVSAWLADGASLYAGTASSGVFATDDGGATWTPLAGGQTLPEVAALVSAPGVLYAGTLGSGVVRLTADDILFADGFESGDSSVWSAAF